MSITENRNLSQRSGQYLRRARALYIRRIKAAVMADQTGDILDRCANKAIERGLYASVKINTIASRKDVRCAMLRRMWRIDVAEGVMWKKSWHFWLDKHRWACYTWTKITSVEASA